MPTLSLNLLTTQEQRLYYSIPRWSSAERTEHFTFTAEQIKQLRQYKPSAGLYFAITLAFFKVQFVLIDFEEKEVLYGL